ncbi:ABC superfamily ATP binding cassette transporter, membrane protein [Agrilactobacillus composti DSM 18527 = JCM 14202]|uniref:ABC superfamily ATP binding cassette transporter, membrane protein n=1 Tax=Agrilactobacillus composti DSM 18527 = JCM 14202 TaxID=1423734 RepID=X0PSP2_9LACO|nr:amino acid ABC transporter permease [Agrilactobacillus composti]KRM33199.1 ABC superfamily ATP binding cassette transporter, membrane protein [Agrilactobacillus composti DSM 18527 = JCM 14202]MCH4171341.1 amino acid ABC transporter permease [Lactobacillus sp.]GAF40271.1 polar amino acid ABC uptake transporter membrane-spanning protein [Agrilactobacillus composti DSM 18527 = JCM 14202]
MSWQIIQQSLPMFQKGFILTLQMSALGILGAIILGLMCSLCQYFKIPVLKQIVGAYIELSRNTPLLIQLFFIYYGLPGIGLKLSAYTCGIIGLIFLGGSYMAEGFSGGFDGIPNSQIESGKAIGLSQGQLTRYVVFPQGFALSIPALAANIIFLIKETSIFTVIAIPELTNTALDLIGLYYHTNEYLLVLVVGYAIILIPLSIILTWLERRIRYGTFGD